MSAWRTENGRTLVIFSRQALATFVQHRQTGSRLEAGGILLGFRRGSHYEIAQVTVPAKTDFRSRFLFSRGPRSHQKAATKWWRSNAEKGDYVGEWHTHAEPEPLPSGIDRAEWTKLVSGRGETATMVFVIVGTAALYVARVASGAEPERLLEIDDENPFAAEAETA